MSGAVAAAPLVAGAPPPIRKLEEKVVNRIAAGEVVQRPANAVKEMLENSLDAGSTSITITAKGGGMKMLQIQDNGHGIRKEDLGIVCERFTTSKLRDFSDLRSISTFGFRGEALASITHVAHVTITSKTKDSPCAYRARYSDGSLIAFRPGQAAKPQPCAGVGGTTILVEDMFYNMDTRKRAFKNPSEQYQRILEVVTRYAIHYGDKGISFTCKKGGEPSPDIHTPPGSSSLANIRIAFGASLARELLPVSATNMDASPSSAHSQQQQASEREPSADSFQYSAEGLVSNANYSSKKSVFILFINNRLVESSSIKKTLEAVYAELLPKGAHPFMYLSLTLPAAHLDVNVHPTKREVHFLFESRLLAALFQMLEAKLRGANESRKFYSQAILPGVSLPVGSESRDEGNVENSTSSGESSAALNEGAKVSKGTKRARAEASSGGGGGALPGASQKAPAVQPRKLVRTDANAGKLDGFVVKLGKGEDCVCPPESAAEVQAQTRRPHAAPGVGRCTCCRKFEGIKLKGRGRGKQQGKPQNHQLQPRQQQQSKHHRRPDSFVETSCTYHSIQELLGAIKTQHHKGLTQMFKRITFVGMVDTHLSLVQYNTKLVLVNHGRLSREMFYQMALRRFQVAPKLSLLNAVPVQEFQRGALDMTAAAEEEEDKEEGEGGGEGEHGDKDNKDALAAEATRLLRDKAAMLETYFNVCFTATENQPLLLTGLPELVEGHSPVLEGLPEFLLRLATEVNWADEKKCFASIAKELSRFYSQVPEDDDTPSAAPLDASAASAGTPQPPPAYSSARVPSACTRQVQDLLYPAFRWALLPPERMANDGTFTQLACLELMYKVFERC